MRVLVVEGGLGGSAAIEQELRSDGHQVIRCHEEGGSAFPCAGLVSGADCPMDVAPVDAVVSVAQPGAGPGDPASFGEPEAGMSCALRRHIPLVVDVGDLRPEVLSRATGTYQSAQDVSTAVAAAVSAPLQHHEAAAREVFDQVLALHADKGVTGDVAVHRQRGNLVVQLSSSAALPSKVREMAAVRVTGALRALDPSAAQISVKAADPA